MNNNEAFEVYTALKQPVQTDKATVIKSLDNLQIYLEELCKRSFRGSPKIGFIHNWVFSNNFESKDEKHYLKANIFAAAASLRRIITYIKEHEMSIVLNRMMLDFICDLKPFIIRYDNQQYYDWLIGNTNSHITNFYFNLAESIFYNGTPGTHEQEFLALSSSTPFIIRQSVEYKIKRILGINYITVNGLPDKTVSATFFKALRNNQEYYNTKKMDFEIVEKIHSWTHLYIHGGFRPRPWITETALSYLKDLFYAGSTSDANSFSLYAGIEVKRDQIDSLKKRTSESIKRELGDTAEIVWFSKPEVAFVLGDT